MEAGGNSCTQETACYVRNYGALDETVSPIVKPIAKFDDKASAFQAMRKGTRGAFATVAMVERRWMPGRDPVKFSRPPNTVLFMVFDEDENLSTRKVQLDNKGFNTFNPGNCLACHGISSTYDFETAKVSDAFFLPFDLQSFEYFSLDPTRQLSREFQESSFKALNLMVYSTDLSSLAAVPWLYTQWYGDGFSSDTFHDTTSVNVPFGWKLNPNSKQLYAQVVAKACRTCHVSAQGKTASDILMPTLAFGTFSDFLRNKAGIARDVCGPEKFMPQAEQTMKLFWQSSARSHLLNRALIRGTGCGFEVNLDPQ